MALNALYDCFCLQVRFMSARASVAFITDQVEEIKQRQFVDLVPGIVQVSNVTDLSKFNVASPKNVKSVDVIFVVPFYSAWGSVQVC